MLITISRQLGSGGGRVGQIVAERLKIPYADREILQLAAQQAGVSEEAIQEADERRPSILDRMSSFVIGYQAPLVGEYLPPEVLVVPTPTHESYRRLVEDVIRQLAERGDAVIVGRGAQVILRDKPAALHVYIYAPMEFRVRAIAARDHIDEREALHRARESDRRRSGYLRSYYGVDWQAPELYDLIINSGRLGLETAADLVIEAARSLGGRPQPG